MRDYSAKESVIAPGQPTKTRTPFELLVGDGVNYSRSRVLSFGGNQGFSGAFTSQYASFQANKTTDVPYGNMAIGSPLSWNGGGEFTVPGDEPKEFAVPRLCPLAINYPSPVYQPGKYITSNGPARVFIPITGVLGHEAIRVLFLLIPDAWGGGEVSFVNATVELELMRYHGSTEIDDTGPTSFSPAIKVSQTYELSTPDYNWDTQLSYWRNFEEGCYNQDDVKMLMASGRFGSLSLTGFPDFASRVNYAGSEQEEPYILRFSVIAEPGITTNAVKLVGCSIIAESK